MHAVVVGPCFTCDDKEAGKPVSVTLTWDQARCGAPPASVSNDEDKGTTTYDSASGVIQITSDGKLGSQQDFSDGQSLHTSCSGPFGIGVRTFSDDAGEDKQDQGCTSSGCWVVTEAVSENGGIYCSINCPFN